MNLPTLTFLLLLLTACGHDAAHSPKVSLKLQADSTTTHDITARAATAAISFEIIDGPEGTFGYDIILNGKVVIHQPNIPGMPGLKGFASRNDAKRVAVMIIDKLKNNHMLPAITKDELKQLGVVE